MEDHRESKRIAEGTKEKRPIQDWIKSQGRFKHLLDPKWKNLADEFQENVDKKWEERSSCPNSESPLTLPSFPFNNILELIKRVYFACCNGRTV